MEEGADINRLFLMQTTMRLKGLELLVLVKSFLMVYYTSEIPCII